MDFFDLNAVLLARVQFAFTVAYHIIFPAFSIGLASFLAVIEFLYLRTKKPIYKEIFLFWIKIFAIFFAVGVVTGVTMSYQIGTNWSGFSDAAGNVIGPLMGYEVLTAFFLEASFLGIMLFGWDKVSDRMHFVATLAVAGGTLISAFWILSVNSWMQTPTGYSIAENGIFFPEDWIEIIFNPSFLPRLFHMITAAYLTTAFAVGGVAAYYLIKKKYIEKAKIMFSMAMLMAFFVAPTQLLIGDWHGLNTYEHQPIKLAAIEGIWENEQSAGFRLFAIPDSKNETNKYEINIPYLSSYLLTREFTGEASEIKGLKNWEKSERPPVGWVFWSFRVMLFIGTAMIFTGIVGAYLYYRKRLFTATLFHRWCVLMAPSGVIAVLAGWFVTEIGRQPYVIYGLQLTSDAVAPITGQQVAWSLAVFVFLYVLILIATVFYTLRHIKRGMEWKGMQPIGSHGVKDPTFLGNVNKSK